MATTANKNCKQFIGIVYGSDGITARSGDEPGKGTVKLQTAEINEDESTSSETVYQISNTGSTDVEVYNYTELTFAENDKVEVWQDGYGVFWVTPAKDRFEYFIINKNWNGEGTPPNTPSIFMKGSLHYVTWDGSDWVPHSANETTSSTSQQRPTGSKLVVCQEDAPTDAVNYKMPYFAPEDNMGVPPDFSTSVSVTDAGERCGVMPGEHAFTNKCLDYRKIEGSYVYEPQFTATVQAMGQTGGNQQLYIDINNNQYECTVPQYNPTQADNSGPSYPDIYPYDYMVVTFDCEKYTASGLDYPRDYPEGTIMPWYRPNPWTSPAAYCGRGWSQYIPSGSQGVITAVNIDKSNQHYDSSTDSIWVEAGVNDKIQVKEGCLCFIEKNKTGAIV